MALQSFIDKRLFTDSNKLKQLYNEFQPNETKNIYHDEIIGELTRQPNGFTVNWSTQSTLSVVEILAMAVEMTFILIDGKVLFVPVESTCSSLSPILDSVMVSDDYPVVKYWWFSVSGFSIAEKLKEPLIYSADHERMIGTIVEDKSFKSAFAGEHVETFLIRLEQPNDLSLDRYLSSGNFRIAFHNDNEGLIIARI